MKVGESGETLGGRGGGGGGGGGGREREVGVRDGVSSWFLEGRKNSVEFESTEVWKRGQIVYHTKCFQLRDPSG
ncbi:hypothetical protein M0802_005728 [Mischocyttarus mexicanus]|nr:hypothetical protein M0802_005728 [Mischocyttarus mexicanus]